MANVQAPKGNDKPLYIRRGRSKFIKRKYFKGSYEKILSETYKKDEICVYFDEPNWQENIESKIKAVIESFKLEKKLFNIGKITYQTCDNCNIPVVLLKGANIHAAVNTEGVRAGSVPTPPVVGEKYSLNFYNKTPFDVYGIKNKYQFLPTELEENKEEIVVAVLDTGFDQNLIDPNYLWKSTGENDGSLCYKGVDSGWNFLKQNSNFDDDHPGRHGTIVSQYIINEFKNSKHKRVKIMPLKTHGENGLGDLFGIICAIYFAIAKGANIINASWGFYYYYQDPIPFLSNLINQILKKEGILFVTAAGNKFIEEEAIARQIYREENNGNEISEEGLRNLALHNFYPAHLSRVRNSVVTVTTADEKRVSPTQNYSNIYADLSVQADVVESESMKFQVPFPGSLPDELISGSSFATAIATGIIGAHCPKGFFKPNLYKSKFLTYLFKKTLPGGSSTILVKNPTLAPKFIKEGAFLKKTP